MHVGGTAQGLATHMLSHNRVLLCAVTAQAACIVDQNTSIVAGVLPPF